LWISRQVLREYAVVMSRAWFIEKPLDSEKIVADINKWTSIFSIADELESVTKNLTTLITSYNISGKRIHDANIVATMMSYSISHLFTKNVDDFKVFKEIQLLEN
jgi:predicted nucleic acid-binding protein